VSLDQLAALLNEGENAGTTRALPADTEVTGPIVLPVMRSGRDECESLVPQHVTEAFEALRGALRSAGVGPEAVDAPMLTGKSQSGDVTTGALLPATIDAGGLARSDVAEPASTEVLRRSFLPIIPLDMEPAGAQQRQATSRRFKRFAAAGILAVIFAGGAASVPAMTSRSDSIPPAGAGNPISPGPAAPIPAPHAGSGNSPGPEGSSGTINSAPADAPGTPADDLAPPAAAAVPAPHTVQASNPKQTTSRPKSPASAATPPALRTPAIPAEAQAWSEMVEASANDYRKAYSRPEVP
jgi:hypothetical protein